MKPSQDPHRILLESIDLDRFPTLNRNLDPFPTLNAQSKIKHKIDLPDPKQVEEYSKKNNKYLE